MNKNSPSVRELLEHLQVQGLITQGGVKRITERLERPVTESKDPLYIRILSGVGAWVAAIFLILFLGISGIIQGGMGALICGIFFLAGGMGIAKASKGTFVNQLSLALVFSGNLLVLFGVGEVFRFRNLSIFVITHAMVCAIVYPFFSNSIYRFLAPTALAGLLTAWIIEQRVFVLMHFLIAAETLFAGTLLLLRKRRALFEPLVYSAALMLPTTLLLMNLTHVNLWRSVDLFGGGFKEPLWPSSLLLSVALIYLYFHLAGGRKLFRNSLLILAVLSTILLGLFTTPGIFVAMGLLIVGYAFDDRILTGLSYVFLLCFIVVFYYTLNIDLAHKSWVIGASGVVLLIVRWIAGRFKLEGVSR
jgi:hypothetical protein